MATKKKPSAAQLAARAKFAAAARAGTLRKKSGRKKAAPKKRAANPAKKSVVRKNPIHDTVKRAPRRVAFNFNVETALPAVRGDMSPWKLVAGFIFKEDAKDYAQALHKAMPGMHIRVVDTE